MTLARTRSAPTIGSIIRTTSLASSRSIFSWRSITAALSGSSPSPLGRASGRPVLSIRTTASGRRPSTENATRFTMPAMVLAASGRLRFSVRMTDALAGCSRDSNSEALAIAMWTRALRTSPMVAIVRAISPSRARR